MPIRYCFFFVIHTVPTKKIAPNGNNFIIGFWEKMSTHPFCHLPLGRKFVIQKGLK